MTMSFLITINIKTMAYVNVDVDLDEFETAELCRTLTSRLKSFGRKKLTPDDKKELRDAIQPLVFELKMGGIEGIEIRSIADQMKSEVLVENWNKFSISDIDKMLSNV